MGDWFSDLGWRAFVEVGGAIGVFVALAVMALVVDKRSVASLGSTADLRVAHLLAGAVLGGLVLLAPIGVLMAMGAARWAPDLGAFSVGALALGLVLCLFNVTTQNLLVRSYIFQECGPSTGRRSPLR